MMHGKKCRSIIAKKVNDSTSEEQLVILAHIVLYPKFCQNHILWMHSITKNVVLRKKGLIVFPAECMSTYCTIYHEPTLSSKCVMCIHLQFFVFCKKTKDKEM